MEASNGLIVGSAAFSGGYTPVLDRQHWPTLQSEVRRLTDLCVKLEADNASLRLSMEYAVQCLQYWGLYESKAMRKKCGYSEDVARLQEASVQRA